MITIKLMGDYQCWPLWWYAGTDKVGNINPETLPLSPNLIKKLEEWSILFDSQIDLNHPNSDPDYGSENEEISSKIENFGLELLKALKNELNGKYKVVYYSNTKMKIIE